MGKAAGPLIGGIVGTVIAPGIGTAIGAGLGAALTAKTNTPGQAAPVAATPAALTPTAASEALPGFAAQNNAADEAQRRKVAAQQSVGLSTVLSSNSDSTGKTVLG